MNRVIVTAGVLGICHMQVCALADATDAEILEVCNRENPSGTSNGWSRVCREVGQPESPVPCDRHADRTHFLVAC